MSARYQIRALGSISSESSEIRFYTDMGTSGPCSWLLGSCLYARLAAYAAMPCLPALLSQWALQQMVAHDPPFNGDGFSLAGADEDRDQRQEEAGYSPGHNATVQGRTSEGNRGRS